MTDQQSSAPQRNPNLEALSPRRIRCTRPDFWEKEELADLSIAARLAFIGLWNFSDRMGRFQWRPRTLKAKILPYDDGINFAALLEEMEKAGFVGKYDIGGECYGHVVGWEKFQSITNAEERTDPFYPAPPGVEQCSSTAQAVPEHDSMGMGKGTGEGKGKQNLCLSSAKNAARETVSVSLPPVQSPTGHTLTDYSRIYEGVDGYTPEDTHEFIEIEDAPIILPAISDDRVGEELDPGYKHYVKLLYACNDVLLEHADHPYWGPTTNGDLMAEVTQILQREGLDVPSGWQKAIDELHAEGTRPELTDPLTGEFAAAAA